MKFYRTCIAFIFLIVLSYVYDREELKLAFTNYGPGNWSIAGIKLPELGLTEKAGGQYNSIYSAGAQGAGVNTAVPYYGTSVQGPSIPSGTSPSGSSSGSGSYSAPSGESSAPSGGSEGPSQDEIEQAYINQYYGEAMNALNSQESALKGNEQNFYNIATTPYTSQIPLVNQAAQEGQNAIVGQQGKAGMQEQNALAAARRLYDELTSRNRQGFGSGALGSVGQAASEVLGRSAQQQFGGIRNQAADTMQQLYTAARDLTEKTNAQLQSLDQQKEAALSQAKLAFQEKLDYINQQKSQVSQAKAQAKLDALKEYRDYVRQMSSQAEQVRQQIVLTAQANGQSIQQGMEQAKQYQSGVLSSNDTGLYNQAVNSNQNIASLGTENTLGGDAGATDVTSQLYGGYNPSTKEKKPYSYLNQAIA